VIASEPWLDTALLQLERNGALRSAGVSTLKRSLTPPTLLEMGMLQQLGGLPLADCRVEDSFSWATVQRFALTSVFGMTIRPQAISAATDGYIASRLEYRGLYPRRCRLFSMETQELRMMCPQQDSASLLSRPSFH
jgi:hypothetical protein